MEIQNSVFTALFVAFGWALVRVVEYFINSKNGKNKRTCFTERHENKLDEIARMAEENKKLHEVYDENHIPLFYFPRETLVSVRETRNKLDAHNKDTEELKEGQAILVNKVSELLIPLKILTERISDLVARLDRKSGN